MQKGFIVDEDLVGLGDDPDLKTDLISMADISGVFNTTDPSNYFQQGYH